MQIIRHEYLTPQCTATTYENGTQILVNYSEQTVTQRAPRLSRAVSFVWKTERRDSSHENENKKETDRNGFYYTLVYRSDFVFCDSGGTNLDF